MALSRVVLAVAVTVFQDIVGEVRLVSADADLNGYVTDISLDQGCQGQDLIQDGGGRRSQPGGFPVY